MTERADRVSSPTTAFRKMLRHAEVREQRKLKLRERIALMRKSLFGNDLNEHSLLDHRLRASTLRFWRVSNLPTFHFFNRMRD